MAKVVVVTGCSRGGLGYALCQQFALSRCRVFATARSVASMDGLKELGCELLALDVTNHKAIHTTVERILKEAGHIDVLVNNAGVTIKGSSLDVPTEAARKLMDVNYFAVTDMVSAAAPSMIQRRSGTILNIGSIFGYFSGPFRGTYAASKFALRAYTDALRVELSPFQVSVTYVAAGFIATNIMSKASEMVFLPSSSPYSSFPGVCYEMHADDYKVGLGKDAMPAAEFAERLVAVSVSSSSRGRQLPAVLNYGHLWWLALAGTYAPIWMTDWWSQRFYCLDRVEGGTASTSSSSSSSSCQKPAACAGKPAVHVAAGLSSAAPQQLLFPSQRAVTAFGMVSWLAEELLLPVGWRKWWRGR